MKIKKKKSPLLIALAIILVVAAGTFLTLHFVNAQLNNSQSATDNTTNTDSSTPTDSETAIEETTDETQTTEEEKTDPSKGEEEPQKPSANDNKPSTPVSRKLSVSTQNETDGTVTVFTKIYGIPSGTCTLTASNGARSVTERAEVMYQPEHSTCAGFSIAKSRLGSGTWNIRLVVSYDGSVYTKEVKAKV